MECTFWDIFGIGFAIGTCFGGSLILWADMIDRRRRG